MLKKIPKYLSVLALGLIPLSHGNDIEPGKEFYTATKAGGPVTIDGILTEWGGVPVLSDPKFAIPKGSGATGTYVLFEPYSGGTWSGPDDQTSAVQVTYDENNIYFGIVVTDDYHENSAMSAWNGDAVQIMIANSDRTSQIALYNYALGGIEDALADTIILHEAGPAIDDACGCATEAIVTRDSVKKKTYYEIRLPAASMGFTPPLTAGMKFGLGMAINDGDDGAGQEGQKGWGGLGAHALVFGKSPGETALVTLGTNGPGTDAPFLSAINPQIETFTFRANDKGTAIVDPASVKLTINGQTVTLTASPKVGDATDFKYTASSPFPPNSTNTYVIEVKDVNGVAITESGTFKTPDYAILATTDKVTPDTSKPGFTWRVHQNNAFTENSIARAMAQLAGALGENFADPNAQGPALAPGTAEASNLLPIDFDIETVINLNQDGFSAGNGEMVPDDQMPGIPGLGLAGQTDGIAAEITTYVELPAGLNTLIVNSDDGFRTLTGNINDIFQAKVAGQFDDLGGRGATDSPYSVYVPEAGVYAFRTIYQEGGGGANIEWKYVKSDGTHVLLNDEANGGPKAYRAITSPAKTGIRAVLPVANSVNVSPDTQFKVILQEGSDAVDLATLKLSLNETATTAAGVRSGNLINLNYSQTTLFAPKSTNTATLVYSAGGVLRTQNWSFVVSDYVTLTPDLKVTQDASKPGFIWRVHQNPADTATELNRPIQQLAGLLGENFADPNAIGVALDVGTPGANTNMPITFEIESVINMSQFDGDANGEFTPDGQMPGIPSLSETAQTDGIAGEITTYVQLPAGKVTMIVNSDDGFRTLTGNINDVIAARSLGEFNAGRGAADTAFSFFVQEAGVYPFRTIWMEGGGGANIEWKIVKSDGTHALLNDEANGGPKTFRAVTSGLSAPSITSISPVNGFNKTVPTATMEAIIQENVTGIDNGSIQFSIDGSSVTPTITRSGKVVTVRATPGSALSVGSHTNKLVFTYGGTQRVAEWSYSVPQVIADKLHGYPAQLLGTVAFTDDKGGHTGAAGDTAMDFGTSGTPSVLIPDASFVNATTADDQMSFSLWIKKYDNANSSAFWADATSAPSAQRGFQAHTPWSDNNVYFDTAGCCDADDTRISAGISTFAGYTDPSWWNDWHHWVFVKNAGVKQIYIDGQLFLEGGAITALPTDFARIWLGAEGGGADKGIANNIHGVIDDFAVFGSALTQADAQALFNGTAPSALDASTKPLAYWDFNTTSTGGGDRPTIAASRSGGVITLSWPSTATGFKLKFSPTIDGTFSDVSGVTGTSYQITNPTGKGFYMLQK